MNGMELVHGSSVLILQDIKKLAYDKAKNYLIRDNKYSIYGKIKLISFLREQNWWRVKLEFKEGGYVNDDFEDIFVYRRCTKTFQVGVQRDNRATIVGYGEKIPLTGWEAEQEDLF
jgi:hypothetical protein